MNRIYLDYAATTPVKPEVVEAMLPVYAQTKFDKTLYEAQLRTFEKAIGAAAGTVAFNHGGSYGDNAAIRGLAGLSYGKRKRIITSRIEHPAVFKVFEALVAEGFELAYVNVDAQGVIDLIHLESLLGDDTAFVSIMWVNNEIGTIQPIDAVIRLCRAHGAYSHVDAVQALGNLEIDVTALDVDVMTFSSHKVYAPKGCGAIYVKHGIEIKPYFTDCGDLDRLNLPYIVGFTKGVSLSYANLYRLNARKKQLKHRLIDGLRGLGLGIRAVAHDEEENHHPGIVSFYFPQMDSDSLIINFDFQGIAISGGSACSSGALSASHVLKAIGMSEIDAKKCVRMTIGDLTTEEEIDRVVSTAAKILKGLGNA